MKNQKRARATAKKKTAPALDRAPQVSIIMGSDSDYEYMKEAALALREMGVSFEIGVISAHRTPEEMFAFAAAATERGTQVIIAGAGGAAHLPGMVAALTEVPVIGVPIPLTHLSGQDSLYSIVQMPKGVPVATVAIGNAFNAGILAAQIVAFGGKNRDEELVTRLRSYKEYLRLLVKSKKLPPLK